MIDESLLKSNFLGRDGFRWWIGQIPPESAHGAQINGGGWGNRYKVRIMGYHPYNTVELADEDLPWAQVLIPTTSGSGAANQATDVKLSPSDIVFGFFLDGDNGQIPVILATFGRTSQVPSKDYTGPFIPFTGYTDKIKPPNGTLPKGESSEQNVDAQKSPRYVAPAQAPQIGSNEISYFSGIGDQINAITGPGSTIQKISTEINNLLKFIQDAKTFIADGIDFIKNLIAEKIDLVTEKIKKITSGLVGGMVGGLFKALTPILNKGLKLLYESVYNTVLAATGNSVTAHLAGVAAQTAMIDPVKKLQDAIPCVTNSIINGLGDIIKNILTSMVDNVANFVSCVSDQVTGSLVNNIIGAVESGLSTAISGISNILKFFSGFSVSDTIRNSPDIIGGLSELVNCNSKATNNQAPVNVWTIGKGPTNSPGPNLKKIMDVANVASSIASAALSSGNPLEGIAGIVGGFDIFNAAAAIPGFSSPLGGCYVGPPTNCGAPSISIFGSEGSGASAIPILGSVVGEGVNRTASIIGAIITSGGSGYNFPPFIEITDNCNKGYGAIARSVIQDGVVTAIYIVSEGENYPVGEIEDYVVSNIEILSPGQNYSPNDKVVDNLGNTYNIQVFDGSIIKVEPINTTSIKDLPVLTAISNTGSGAILKPLLAVRPEFQGEVKQVIDCIT